jgi:HD-like signal output (HDOD) protein
VTEELKAAMAATKECETAEEMLEKAEVETAQLGALAKLPACGPVAVRLKHLFDRDDVEICAIAELVSSDVALASELLALANSPLFALQTSIGDLQHAITVLGTERTKALATVLAVRSMLNNAPRTTILRRIWRHGLATAVIAKELAPSYGLSKNLALVAGIIHGLGRLALLAANPQEYAPLATPTHENTESVLEAERKQFGLDHCQAGQLLSESWHFPKELQRVAGQPPESLGGRDLLSMAQTACRLAAVLDVTTVSRSTQQIKSIETIAAHVPAVIRARVLESVKHKDRQILDRYVSLDF